MSKATEEQHTGFKYIHLLLTAILAAIWSLFNFFGWLTALVPATLVSFSYGLVGLTIYLFFAFIWSVLHNFFKSVSAKIAGLPDDWHFKYLFLTIMMILGALWTLFSFFSWLTLIDASVLMTYGLGLVGLTIVLFFVFIWEVAWSFFHKVSEKV